MILAAQTPEPWPSRRIVSLTVAIGILPKGAALAANHAGFPVEYFGASAAGSAALSPSLHALPRDRAGCLPPVPARETQGKAIYVSVVKQNAVNQDAPR
jgi:hypothetical protein